MMNSKIFFIKRMLDTLKIENPRILELSCGTARYMPEIFKSFPHISYAGVEPHSPSLVKARETIGMLGHVQLYSQTAYGTIPGLDFESFDLVFSLSALEHIKNLPEYIRLSSSYCKPNGLVVHRYDLGHALYPTSIKERIHALLGTYAPALLPEDTFVRYIAEADVVSELEKNKCGVFDMSYHLMPNVKQLEKIASKIHNTPDMFLEPIYAWEMDNRAHIKSISLHERERLFPSVAVWSRKEFTT